MKKIYLLLVVAFYATISHAQVTGTKTIGTDYPTIAAAVTALNTSGVGAGGATINIPAAYTETAPSGGIVLGSTALNATLTGANKLKFVKSGTGVNPVLTAFTGGTSTTSDGIFKIAGADSVTIDGLDLKENAANTGAALMEWGYALVNLNAVAPFDGVQGTTIQNCKVTMDKTNPNASMGFYSAHNIATANTALTITSANDAHSNNKFYGNTVTNAGFGFFILGFNAATPYTLYDQGNDVGGTTAATGNTLSNIGGPAGFNVFGIYLSYQNGQNASNNTISGVTAVSGTAITVGIYYFGTNANSTANNNTITVSQSAATGNVAGIYAANTGNVTATGNTITFSDPVGSSAYHYGVYSASITNANLSTNTFKQTSVGTSSGYHYFVYQSANAATSCVMNGNKFDNLSLKTSGYVYLIYCSNATATYTANNNVTVGNFVNTVGGGYFYGFYNFGSPTGGTATLSGNNFSNISVTGTGLMYGIYQATGTSQIEILSNNTISNITAGSGAAYGLYHSYGAAGSLINGNTVSGISGTSSVYGVQLGGTQPGGIGVYSNTISGLSTTGAGTVYGISYSGGTNGLVYKNKISGLSANNAGGAVYGITVAGGTTSVSVYNNLIGDLTAPATTSAADAIRGINLTTTTANLALNVYNNTVYINATSTGANFSTSALFATTSATATSGALTMRNNILWNGSTPKGTGFTTAYRRSSNTLTNYAAASNNNLFFAGAGCTNNAMYYDGTTGYNTIATVQTTLAPRDAASKTELSTPFITTTGVAATFLHLAGSTVAEGGGASIAAVTDDFDGDARSATTPDIGADEFAGTAPAACSGTPAAGTITGNASVCQTFSNTLTLGGYSNASGITIQWQSATTSGGPYTNIACATGTTLQTGVITPGTTVYYVAVVTCGNGGATATTPQFAVTSYATPTVVVTPAAAAICSNGTGVSLTASGAATYAWAPATGLSAATGATVTANPAATTTYTVTGTTTQGCIGTGTAVVTVNAAPVAPTVTPTAASICPGGIQMITATPAVGNPNLINENFNTVAVGALPTGWTQSIVTVPASTCTWGAFAAANAGGTANEMRLNLLPSAVAEDGTYSLVTPVLNAAGLTGVSLTFRDTMSHYSSTYVYSINVETSTDNVNWTTRYSVNPVTASTPAVSHTISLSALDNTASFYVRFALKGRAFGAFYWFIDNVVITGTAAPAAVTWSPATGLYTNAAATTPYVAGASATTVYASPTVTTTYSASVKSAAGCISSTTSTITVNTVSVAPTSATASNTSICGTSGTVNLTAVGGTLGTGASYKWYTGSCGGTLLGTGATLSNVFVNQTTTYYVRAEGTCNNTTCASVTVNVNPVPSVVLTAANGSTNPVVTNPATASGLTATVSPAGNYVYSWTLNGVVLPVLTSSITPANGLFNAFGTYQVTVTNVASGCTATSNTIAVSDNAAQRDRLFIYPNPTSGVVYVSYYSSTPAAQSRILNVYDSKGSRLMSQNYTSTGAYGQMRLDLTNLVSGVYMVELTDASNKRIKIEQVIKN